MEEASERLCREVIIVVRYLALERARQDAIEDCLGKATLEECAQVERLREATTRPAW